MVGSATLRDPEIERARTFARWMDRYGLDPLIGLIPGIGDVLGAALGLYIVSIAVRRGMSTPVIIRMFVGVLPVIGDIADFFYKANEKNFALLEERLAEPPPDAMRKAVDWGYLIGAVVAVLGLFGLAIYGLVRVAQRVL
jgi:hypothetical protein